MKIFQAFRQGVSLVARDRKIIGLIYLFNLCVAAIFALPLFILFHKQVGPLVVRGELASPFNYAWWSGLEFSAKGHATPI